MEPASVNWRKSTHSGNNGADCVEVGNAAPTATGIVVRDTTNRSGATLTFPKESWQAFTATLR
jgi:hypothetical protein